MCQHCAEPPCVDVCPTGPRSSVPTASWCWSDRHLCIGCRYCMMACPTKARSSCTSRSPTRSPTSRGRGCVGAARCACRRQDRRGDHRLRLRPASRPGRHRVRRPQRSDERDRAPRAQTRQRAAAPRSRVDRACATTGCDGHARRHPAMRRRTRQTRNFWLLAAVGITLVTRPGDGADGGARHYVITGMDNQVVWGLPHVFAIFMIVAASGVLNVASVGSVFRAGGVQSGAPRCPGLVEPGAAGSLGLMVLMLDLGRPTACWSRPRLATSRRCSP